MVKGEPYTRAADIWSLGVVLFANTVGRLPFSGPDTHAVLRKIVRDAVVYPSQLGPQLMDLLTGMLRKDPEMRITLEGIIAHSWISRPEEGLINLDDLTSHLRPYLRGSCDLIPDVVDRLRDAGYNVKDLRDEIAAGSFSELMCAYRILVRDRMADLIKDAQARPARRSAPPGPRRLSINLPFSGPRAIPAIGALPWGSQAVQRILPRPRSSSQKESFREMPLVLHPEDVNTESGHQIKV
jgi:serine/threonine protein kinase